tara:strand:- start:3228 stop:3608 length:381 start_codon:yes stop_codon:yes gene_type:complete
MLKALEYLIKNMDTLMEGVNSTIKGSVKFDKNTPKEDCKHFTMKLDWSKTMFSYILNLAGQSIRIQEQAKMRLEWNDLGDTFDWDVEVAKKEKRTASKKQAYATFDRLSPENQQAFIADLLKLKKK